MNNFLIAYNYLKNAFERKKVPFPAELAAILEPTPTTPTTMQSSNNSNNTVGCSNIKSTFACYFADFFFFVLYENTANAF
jgi:hypothetical protein